MRTRRRAMKTIRLAAIVCLIALLGGACRNVNGGGGDTATVAEQTEPQSLPMPEIPTELTDSYERMKYALSHYWDKMNWRDTMLLNNDAYIEQSMANYLFILSHADSLMASKAVNRMLASASVNPKALAKLTEMASRYLYEPESPMYNAESYAILLDQLMLDPTDSGISREKMIHDHMGIMKNRVGNNASDFRFVDAKGRTGTLTEATKGARQTILIFYDPDCNVCAAVEKRLAESQRLNDMLAAGTLRIVAIDPFDGDRTKWTEHAATLPSDWIVGYSPDGAIDENETYVIRATPAVYLLDGDMTVIEKDADDATIATWL